jgi:uncharacterized damage-inducible protein DinB
MSEVTKLVELVAAGYSGAPWHGPSLKDNLQGVTAAQASQRLGSGHTIWELVLHLAVWRGEIARRLQGHEAGTPPEGDFPSAPHAEAATDSEWRNALARLDSAQQNLLAAATTVPDEDLHKPVLDFRSNPSGQGATRFVTLVGIAQHDAYHSGQIALLQRS